MFGQVVLEAQASGLPVVAVSAGGPAELIDSGRTGMLCPASASALADAVAGLAASPRARERLAHGGLAAVRERTWEASLAALGAGWMRALATAPPPPTRRAPHDPKHHRTTDPAPPDTTRPKPKGV